MFKSKPLLWGLCVLASFISCKKTQDDLPITKLANVNAPEGSTWESASNLDFRIEIGDDRFGDDAYIISVYDEAGTLYLTGTAKRSEALIAKAKIPANVKSLIIIKTAPDSSSDQKSLNLPQSEINVHFGRPATTVTPASKFLAEIYISRRIFIG